MKPFKAFKRYLVEIILELLSALYFNACVSAMECRISLKFKLEDFYQNYEDNFKNIGLPCTTFSLFLMIIQSSTAIKRMI